MATEGKPESLEEKLGELKIGDASEQTAPVEESEAPEKFEDSKDTPVEETPEEVLESVVAEIKEGHIPELQHVETHDTTDPVKEDSTEGDVVKAEVPVAFEEELKQDHSIVPAETEAPPAATEDVSTVETVKKEVGAEDGVTAPATSETPVVISHEDVDTKSKASSIGEKISQTIHSIVGKE